MAEEDYDEINRILNNNTDLPKEEQLEKVKEFVNETMKNMTPEDVAKAQKMKEDAQLIKDEFFNSPPVLLLVGRPDDAWLATWSRAEGYLAHPVDPFALVSLAAKILR